MMDYRYGLPWNQERGERKRLLAAAVFVMPLSFLQFLMKVFASNSTFVLFPFMKFRNLKYMELLDFEMNEINTNFTIHKG